MPCLFAPASPSAGNAGSAVTQALFFTGTNMTTLEGFKWLGVMIIAVTATLVFIHFPMWGGMLTRGSSKVTEEEYYRCVLPRRTAYLRTALAHCLRCRTATWLPGLASSLLHLPRACSLTLPPPPP